MTGLHDAAIAMMVIALAGNLGLNVIAVGVEAEGHRDLLADPGCLNHQCHPFNRPLPIEEFEQFSKRACDTSLPLLVTALERPVLKSLQPVYVFKWQWQWQWQWRSALFAQRLE